MRGPTSLCAAVFALWAAPCVAQTTAYAPGHGSPNSIVLNVPVTASVNSHCGFATGGAPSGTFNQPNFDSTGFSHDFLFQLDCTGPVRVAVVSANGSLLAPGSPPSGYAAAAPYDVELNLVGDSGPPANASCAVATLTPSSSCNFVGPASSSQGLLLSVASNGLTPDSYLRVSAPIYSGPSILVASAGYTDTLTVTLSASP
jgi:hypothetical protein